MAKDRISTIIRLLGKAYPDAMCELNFSGAYQVLIATVLSAQCTDLKVNQVTPELFARYPDPQTLAKARLADVENIIHSLGLYHNKAANIIAASRSLCENFGGEVPQTMDELVTLAGVGRKTANCVLINAFNQPGIMVDTHCIRLVNRLGLVQGRDAVKIEMSLKSMIAVKQQAMFSHRIILHGRRVCHARKPECAVCVLSGHCPSFGVV